MSTAAEVPETWELSGDDAAETLRTCGTRVLLRDAAVRLRAADGFSHARSLAYATTLVIVQALIALVGLASALGKGSVSNAIVRTIHSVIPGAGGRLLTDAVTQAHRAGASHRYLGLLFGVLGALITGATLMGQLERGLNRIYGIEQDRPTLRKYSRALVMALSVGLLTVVAFTMVAFGTAIGGSVRGSTFGDVWRVVRWPSALVLITASMALLFRWAPRRHQPRFSWLAFGAGISTLSWLVVTVLLSGFFSLSKSFGKTYGPLAGIVAVLLWSLLSAVAILYGAAVAAQLEAIRAGANRPRDRKKAEEGSPRVHASAAS